jgi:hypothetical protein
VPPKELSRIHVYELPDRLFLHPLAITEAGFWVAIEPGHRLELAVSDEELGSTVQTLIVPVQRPVPTPRREDYTVLARPLLQAAGVKTWLTLEGNARLCGVARELEQVVIVPTRNGGTRGDQAGFHDLDELARALPLPVDSIQLGRAVRDGLALSRGPQRAA